MSNITNLKCVVCGKPIEVGEPLLANKSGELAHQQCVQERSPLPEILIPSVQITPVKLEYQPPPKLTVGSITTAPEPCIMPSPPKVCSECGKPCIAMCPHCRALVHSSYGYNNEACSLRHEAKCAPAREDRSVTKTAKTVDRTVFVIDGIKPGRNGHTTPKKKGRSR